MNAFLRHHRHWILAALAILLVVSLLAAFREYTQDDVFITYTYSRNIALGNGFVFNPGESVQGTTTPLYTFLLAAIYRITPDLLHSGNLLSTLFLLTGCGLAVTLPRHDRSPIGQIAIVLMLLTSPLIYVSFGMETLLYFALLMASFQLWAHERRGWAIVTAAALTWTRVAIHPGAGTAIKRWSPDAWAHVADTLGERWNATILFTGSSSEKANIEAIRSAMTYGSVSLAGKTDIGMLAALYVG